MEEAVRSGWVEPAPSEGLARARAKELLVLAPLLLAFLMPPEHRRLRSIQGENCKMEDKNSKGHLRGKPTLSTSKLCYELPSSPFSTPTLSPS